MGRRLTDPAANLQVNISRYVNLYFEFIVSNKNANDQFEFLKKINGQYKKWLRQQPSLYVYEDAKNLFFNRISGLMDLISKYDKAELKEIQDAEQTTKK